MFVKTTTPDIRALIEEHAQDFLYITRVALTLTLTWLSAFYLNLDKPGWALLTVLIIALPSPGALVAKFVARFIGTLSGAVAVNIIASLSLGFPWVMGFFLASWLAICSYGASFSSGMVRYGCALSGYTAAILGFALSTSPTAYTVFYLTQARVSDVILGLTCSLVVSFLFPSDRDYKQLHDLAKNSQRDITQLFQDIVLQHKNTPEIQKNFDDVAYRLVQMRQLIVYEYLPTPLMQPPARHSDNAIYGELDALTAFLTLHTQYTALQEEHPAKIQKIEIWKEKLTEWCNSALTGDRETPPPPPDMAGEQSQQYVDALNKILEGMMYFTEHGFFPDKAVNKGTRVVYRDRIEPLLNSARTLLAVMGGMAFWLGSQWDVGYILVVIMGIGCCLGATYPKAGKLVLLVLFAGLCGIGVAAVLQFVLYIKVSSLWGLVAATLPFIFIFSYGKARGGMSYLFWHVCSLAAFFLVSYDNIMEYDYSSFLNLSMAAMTSITFLAIVFGFIPQSKDAQVIQRMQASIIYFLRKCPRPLSQKNRVML